MRAMTAEPVAAPMPIAVFDFDGTIVSGDTMVGLLWALSARSLLRRASMFVLCVLMAPWLAVSRLRRMPLSGLLWIATVGAREGFESALDVYCQQVVAGSSAIRVFPAAKRALHAHFARGERVVILSGAPAPLVARVMDRVAPNACTIVASELSVARGGVVLLSHCTGKSKLRCADAAGLPPAYGIGYGDSVHDLPLLARCRERCIVNPSGSLLRHAKRAFGAAFVSCDWRCP